MASGGLDSTTMMYELHAAGALKAVFFARYGQASAAACLSMVRWHARRCGNAPVVVLDVHAPKHHGGRLLGVYKHGFKPSNKRFPPDSKAVRKPTQNNVKNFMYKEWSWIEGRNSLFFIQAAILAGSMGLDTIYTAFQFNQVYWDVPAKKRYLYDTGPEFVRAMNNLFSSGAFIEPMRVEAPYLDAKRDKVWIIRRGLKLGADLSRTHSCEFYPACGRCSQCQIKESSLGLVASDTARKVERALSTLRKARKVA
jgi:7-cyano-7-deazaguanine synthase in queuosine biosynthesis